MTHERELKTAQTSKSSTTQSLLPAARFTSPNEIPTMIKIVRPDLFIAREVC